MEKATVSRLKRRLGVYLRKVRAGETVLVFDRGRPVARIEPVSGREGIAGRLARLEAAGLVSRPASALPMKALRAAPPRPRRSVLKALLDERR